MSETAAVFVSGARVGTLERLGEEEDHLFTYDPAWLNAPEPPVLGQLFEDRRPGPIRSSGMLAWFAHLLPPPPLRRHLVRWARLGEDPPDIQLLLAMGTDLPGAVELLPGAQRGFLGGKVPLVEEPAGSFAFALPGAQWKLSIHAGERGLVVPVRGETGEFIAKFHDPSHPRLPAVESATTRWAARSGVRTHAAELVDVGRFPDLPPEIPRGDGTVFLATRFDRLADRGRVHVEDFGQISGSAPSGLYGGTYEQLAALVAVLCPSDVLEFLHRLTFVLVSGNGDAHWKNWGVVYPNGRTPALSPAYDLVSTVVYNSRETLALPLGGSTTFDAVDAPHLEGVARAVGLGHSEVLTAMRRAREAAETVWAADDLGFSPSERAAIGAHLARLPRW